MMEAEVWPPLEVVEFRRTPFSEQVNISVSIEPIHIRVITRAPFEVITYKRIPFQEQVSVSVSIETVPIRVVTKAPLEIITFKRTPFYERLTIGVSVTRRFEEATDYSFEIGELFLTWSPFAEACHLEGYVFSDMEMIGEVRYIKKIMRQIRAVVIADGLDETTLVSLMPEENTSLENQISSSSDLELIEDIRYIKNAGKQIRTVIITNGLEKEKNPALFTV